MTSEVGILVTREIGGPGAAVLAPFEIPCGIVLGVSPRVGAQTLSGSRSCLHPRGQDALGLSIGTGVQVVLRVGVGQVGLEGGELLT